VAGLPPGEGLLRLDRFPVVLFQAVAAFLVEEGQLFQPLKDDLHAPRGGFVPR